MSVGACGEQTRGGPQRQQGGKQKVEVDERSGQNEMTNLEGAQSARHTEGQSQQGSESALGDSKRDGESRGNECAESRDGEDLLRGP